MDIDPSSESDDQACTLEDDQVYILDDDEVLLDDDQVCTLEDDQVCTLEDDEVCTLEDDEVSTPEDINGLAESTNVYTIPPTSKERYQLNYDTFVAWKKENGISPDSWSETVLLAYYKMLKKTKKPTTVRSIFSMLKSMLKVKHNIDTKKYKKLEASVKRNSEGYRSSKAKVFLPNEIKNFLDNAPDDQWLDVKVVAIFGVLGACRAHELVQLTTHDIEYHGDSLLQVHLKNTQNRLPRSFVITGEYFDIVKKYLDLRPTFPSISTDRLIINYQKRKCTTQPIGINKIRKMPHRVAEYLKLPNAGEYKGHSFRRASASFVANAGASVETSKQHGGWHSSAIAESYVEDPIKCEQTTANLITNSLSMQSNDTFVPLVENEISSVELPFVENSATNIQVNRSENTFNVTDFLNRTFSLQNCSHITINIHPPR